MGLVHKYQTVQWADMKWNMDYDRVHRDLEWLDAWAFFAAAAARTPQVMTPTLILQLCPRYRISYPVMAARSCWTWPAAIAGRPLLYEGVFQAVYVISARSLREIVN